ncbi:MAG: amidohydrolase [Lachnospiraceae bacterium]|nr:amidohydrolase [Lachnospiraceae bacterium]
MTIRFYNARILTMEEPLEIFMGELWVKDGKITYCGSPVSAPITQPFDREMDLQGNLILPGFKNAHTHSAMTFLRSFADDLPLQDWLSKQVFPMEALLTESDIYTLSKLAIAEYLTSGITANFDMYVNSDAIAQSSVDTGFRTVIVSGLNNFVHSLKGLADCYETYNHFHPLIRYQLGFHAEYTTNESLLLGVAELAKTYHAPVYTHNSETNAEVADCIRRTGKTPTAYLASLGVYDYGGGGYHCVHFSEEDIAIFKEKHLSVITNPASNLKLASGIAPIRRYLAEGINVALGTDGPASNNCLDMFREMFLMTGLAKVREEDASVVDALSVLRAATVGGAKAMGLSQCHTLTVGSCADLTVLDLHKPNMQPLNHILKNIVYSGSKDNVLLTMVNGRVLYEKGCFYLDEDIETIYEKCNKITQRIKAAKK